jgi:exosortase A-associated hydrolase 1
MLHPADGTTGIVIVTGGAQTRVGSHRGFVDLGDRLAATGYPVLRFDRRGLGDSDGRDPGFRDSRADTAAAVAALRAACPGLERVIGWGLCDGAAALALNAAHLPGLNGLILANPWTRDDNGGGETDLPQRAAIAARYRQRLSDPRVWIRLLRGDVDFRKLAIGMLRLTRSEPPSSLASGIAAGLARFAGPVLVLIAERDNTAVAFESAWGGSAFAAARGTGRTVLRRVPDAGHSFARPPEFEAMVGICLDWLNGSSGRTRTVACPR